MSEWTEKDQGGFKSERSIRSQLLSLTFARLMMGLIMMLCAK